MAGRRWTGARALAHRFGDTRVYCVDDVPEGCPYEQSREAAPVSLAEAVARIEDARRSAYVPFAGCERFAGLRDEWDLADFSAREARADGLSLCSAEAQIGVHFDCDDTYSVVLHGQKRVRMAAFAMAPWIYAYPGQPGESRLDSLHTPDLRRFPLLDRAEVLETTLGPGDALFQPRLWYHHYVASSASVSLHLWVGEQYMTRREHVALLRMLGPSHAAAVLGQMLWYGVLRRPSAVRTFGGEPFGLGLYRRLMAKLRLPRPARSGFYDYADW